MRKFGLLLLVLTGCYYDKEDAIHPTALSGSVLCDTSNGITYSGLVQKIISVNCLSCHSKNVASGGIALENYTSVVNAVNNAVLVQEVNYQPGYNPMPPGVKLAQCQIDVINSWVKKGMPQ